MQGAELVSNQSTWYGIVINMNLLFAFVLFLILSTLYLLSAMADSSKPCKLKVLSFNIW